MHTRWLALIAAFALVSGLVTGAVAQDFGDSTDVRNPSTALRRALVPGWGQLYNRQYVKVPVVYAGMGGLVASAVLVNQRYLLYRHSYLYTARTHEDGSPVFPDYATDYAALLDDLNLPSEAALTADEVASRRQRLEPQLRTQRDALRRNRDLLYLATALWYGLSILDAYVSAHLLEFDVSDDLSLRGALGGLTVALRW